MKRHDLRISSAQNPKLKAAVALNKQRERALTGQFLIEGARTPKAPSEATIGLPPESMVIGRCG